jgi:ABC-2 type transport system permease protein
MTALVFILTMVLGFLVVVAYCMLIYIISFFTISPMGVRMVFVMAADFLSGGLVPLPFLPEWLTKFIYITPFASMQNVPFRIYSGDIAIKNSLYPIILQFVWLIILVIVGKFIMCRALKKVIVQGG